jgi:hypothetical protein
MSISFKVIFIILDLKIFKSLEAAIVFIISKRKKNFAGFYLANDNNKLCLLLSIIEYSLCQQVIWELYMK